MKNCCNEGSKIMQKVLFWHMCLPDRWWGLFGEPVYDETKKKSGLNKLDVGGGGLKKKKSNVFINSKSNQSYL